MLMARPEPASAEGAEPVAVVDRCPTFALGVAAILGDHGFEVQQPDDPLQWARRPGRRALLADLNAEDVPGRCKDLVVVALIADEEPASYWTALRRGAHGVVPRDAAPDDIVRAVACALAGHVAIPAAVAHAFAEDASDDLDSPLSAQEVGWLDQLARGETVAQLADEAGYSERAMYRRLNRVYDRLGACNRTDALLRAVDAGIVSTPSDDGG